MEIQKRLKKLYSFRPTLWNMSLRSLKTKYSGSILGIWWAVATPCILAISINFIFSNVFRMDVQHFTFFVLSGLLPWFFFSNALGETSNCFTGSASILKQCLFPREIIPLAYVLANFLNFLIGFVVLLPLFIVTKAEVIRFVPFLLLVLFSQLMFVAGIGIIFSTLNAFVRDVTHFLPTALMIWFWITPLFYRLEMLDFPYRWVCLVNPMTYYTVCYQHILFAAEAPPAFALLASFFIGITVLVAGYFFFLKNERHLLKRI